MTEEQLRKRVDKYMCNAVPGVNTLTGNLDGIMSLFAHQLNIKDAKHAKALELAKIEAKIEELALCDVIGLPGWYSDYLDERTDELTNQKDLLTKESK